MTPEDIKKLKEVLGPYFVCEGYMQKNDFCMFVNEQPDGGFKWDFIDYEPADKENYRKVIVLRVD
jgi:hypothetical protein